MHKSRMYVRTMQVRIDDISVGRFSFYLHLGKKLHFGHETRV